MNELVRYSDPVVPGTLTTADRDADCQTDRLHVHVWPDAFGINVRTHGNTIELGTLPWSVHRGGRVGPGPFFAWRVRWAIGRATGHVAKVYRRHASIQTTLDELEFEARR